MAPALELLEKPVEYLPVKVVSGISTRASAPISPNDVKLENVEKHQRVMNVFRAFIADLCQQYWWSRWVNRQPLHGFSFSQCLANETSLQISHGMAAIGIVLYKYVMKYSPGTCNYFNRDRFVLSNSMNSVSLNLSPGAKRRVVQLAP